MKLDFTLAGIDSAVNQFESWERDIPKTVARAMNSQAEQTMRRSKDEFCPVDTGFLKSSGSVNTTIEGAQIETVFRYGASYAAPVHEIQKNYRNGKEWKYLETPLKQDLPNYEGAVAEELRDALK